MSDKVIGGAVILGGLVALVMGFRKFTTGKF